MFLEVSFPCCCDFLHIFTTFLIVCATQSQPVPPCLSPPPQVTWLEQNSVSSRTVTAKGRARSERQRPKRCCEFSPVICTKTQGVTASWLVWQLNYRSIKNPCAFAGLIVGFIVSLAHREGRLPASLLFPVPASWICKEKPRCGVGKEQSPHLHTHSCSRAELQERAGSLAAGRELGLIPGYVTALAGGKRVVVQARGSSTTRGCCSAPGSLFWGKQTSLLHFTEFHK